MKNNSRLNACVLLSAILTSLVMPFIQPATPAHAWAPQTWDTQAAFNAGVINNVDTSSSPNNVLLATNLDVGDGSDGPLTVSGFYSIDEVRAPVTATSPIGSSYLMVGPTAGLGFASGQEVLVIQMTGTGAGTWETKYIAASGVEPTLLVFTQPLNNAYYADANSQAQVIKVPHFTNVTVDSSGIIQCHPWYPNGPTGGVIFFRANGTVTVNGVIDASGFGFAGGQGGSQGGGSGGMGGQKGNIDHGYGDDGTVNSGNNTGGAGGQGGSGLMHGWWGGNGGFQGYGGQSGQPGTAGGGPDGGQPNQGGTNGSTPNLSLMQSGGGGGGGSSGIQGYGGGGGGGGGLNACVMLIGVKDGAGGSSGGNPGAGGQGGLGGGIIAIHANSVVASQALSIKSTGEYGQAGSNGGSGGNGGAGGYGENECVVVIDGEEQNCGAGGGGGGGGGGAGGGGGNGGGSGGGGVIWLAANNISLAANGANAIGAPGSAAGQGGSGGAGGAGGSGGGGDSMTGGQNGAGGPAGATGRAGNTGGHGGGGAIRLDYVSMTGSTTPAPGYTSGLYYSSGSIASDVWDTGAADQPWTYLNWQETLAAGTDITFEARASDTLFAKNNTTVPWVSVGGTSPVTSGLPSGRYMQWRATLTTNNAFYTPLLHSVTAAASLGPIVATNAATFVGASGAVMHGTLNSLGQSSSTVNVNFFWGTSPGGPYNPTAWQQMTSPGTYVSGLNGLSPGRTYYFKARADDGVNPPVFGDEVSFTTTPVAPSVATNAAGSITASSAVLNGYLNSVGASFFVDASFQWGTTQGGPYPNSTTAQAMDTAGPFQANLSNLGTGTTYYYRAKADGGANGANYGVERSFTTVRILPSVATGNASSLTSSSATLNGSLANMGAASTVNVSYQWGTTSGGPYPNSTPAQAMTSTGPFSAGLTNLSPKTTYYFRAMGDGGASGISYGSENSFTTAVVQPTVTTTGATEISGYSALLNGNLSALGTAATVDVTFYYGLQPGEFNHTAWQTMSTPGPFQATLTGLTPDTLYYFRTAAQGDGNSVDGAELTFRTSRVPPTVTTNGATLVLTTTARLNGTLTAVGSAASDNVSFQWGTTPGVYSTETTPQTMSAPGDFPADLAGLTSDTTYYYRAKANGGIDGIAYGDEHSFTTGADPPLVTTSNASQLTTNSAMLNGNLDSRGDATVVNVSFQWGTTSGGPYPNSTAPQARTLTGAYQTGLTGLASYTTYYYRAKADGGTFGTAYGAEKSFSTSSFPPHVGTGAAGNITETTATLNGNLYFLGSAGTVNVSFLYGTTPGGPYPFTTAPQIKSAPMAFQADLTGLASDTTYYFRARGDGGQYGISTGQEQRFTTNATPPSVSTSDASVVTSGGATLNGNLSSKGTADNVSVSFQYGTTAGGPYPYTTAPQLKTDAGTFQAGISGLDANTAYYFRAVADGGKYGVSYGDQKSFTTSKIPPSVITDNATNITAAAATLNGDLSSLGTARTVNASFNWGTTQGGPYPNSTTPQAMSATGPFQSNIIVPTALTTYYFIARADDGVNPTVFGDEVSFTSGSVPPSVSTGAATGVTGSSATLNGTLHALGTSPSDNVSFQWGTSPGVYSHQTTLQPRSVRGDFTQLLTGLSGNTTYYYRAVASGVRNGTSFGVEHSFRTNTTPPSVSTGAATDWTTDTAFLNGDLTVKGTAPTVNTSFIYGTSAGGPYPFTTTPLAMTAQGAFRSGITGLSPFTTYYFRAKADGGIYGTGYGDENNFTTNRLPPVMGTGGAIDVMTNAAILNGNLYLMGSASTVNVSFQYGIASGSYTWETSPQPMTAPDAFQAQLKLLTPSITYYYRAKGIGGEHGIGYGEERSFTTGSHPPIVTTNAATSITADAATLNGDLLNPGSAASVNVRFEYGTTQGGPYFSATIPQSKSTAGTFNADVTGLNPLTVYYYRTRADGGIYGTGFGPEKSFITANLPPSVTTHDSSSITTDSASLNGDLTSLGAAGTVNVSFQWGTTRGGPYTGTTPPQAATSAGAFRANLTGLFSNTAYYYIAKADGGVYGVAYGREKSFATVMIPPPPPVPGPHMPGSSGGIISTVPTPTVPTTTVTTITPVALSNVVVQSATLSAAAAAPGEPVEITATVVNRSTVNGSTAIRLYINGQEESVQGITLESGKTRNITFTTSQSRPGTYTVYVGGVQAGSFTVTEAFDSNLILFISMTLILSSLILGLMYVWRRRQQENYRL